MAIEMNENEARVWLRDGVEWIRKGLSLTPTTADDKVCDMVLAAIDSDLIWGWLWKVLDGVLDDSVTPIGAAPDDVVAAAAPAAINPLLVLSIIKALYDLWKMFRTE
jgi:hypothetical protein